MKKIAYIILTTLFSHISFGQKIVNIIFVGPNGITENVKEAHSFIAIKKMGDTAYQRLNYKIHAPLESLQTYRDDSLSILEGPYYSYKKNGSLNISGSYSNNKKENEWYYYNDTFKVIKKEIYKEGILIKTIDPDTVKKERVIDSSKTETEASFVGGVGAWVRFLTNNLNAEVGARSVRGGKVLVSFVINKEGKVSNISLRRSVEFILDEEAIRIISKSPDWHPAVQNDRKVNAYRLQPITFSVE